MPSAADLDQDVLKSVISYFRLCCLAMAYAAIPVASSVDAWSSLNLIRSSRVSIPSTLASVNQYSNACFDSYA